MKSWIMHNIKIDSMEITPENMNIHNETKSNYFEWNQISIMFLYEATPCAFLTFPIPQ